MKTPPTISTNYGKQQWLPGWLCSISLTILNKSIWIAFCSHEFEPVLPRYVNILWLPGSVVHANMLCAEWHFYHIKKVRRIQFSLEKKEVPAYSRLYLAYFVMQYVFAWCDCMKMWLLCSVLQYPMQKLLLFLIMQCSEPFAPWTLWVAMKYLHG